MYAKIRNPIYVFSGLLVLGILISLQYRYALLLLLVLIPVQIVRARQEARVLEARFGDQYRKYRERNLVLTGRIISSERRERAWSKHGEVFISAGHTCPGRRVRGFDVANLRGWPIQACFRLEWVSGAGTKRPGARQSQVQDAPSPAPKSAPAAESLPPGTVLSVELSKSLDAKKSKANAKIEAKTATDLLVHGQIVVPRNTKIIGHVTEAKAHSKASPGSLLGITFERMLVKGGREMLFAGHRAGDCPPLAAQ